MPYHHRMMLVARWPSRRPTGASYKHAMPFSLTPPVLPTGGGGGIKTRRRVLAATAPKRFAGAPPHCCIGAIRAKTNHGRSKAITFRQRISDGHAQIWMFGHDHCPLPFPAPRIGSRAAGSPKGRASSEPLESLAGAAGVPCESHEVERPGLRA
jgi:hypothetical protein